MITSPKVAKNKENLKYEATTGEKRLLVIP